MTLSIKDSHFIAVFPHSSLHEIAYSDLIRKKIVRIIRTGAKILDKKDFLKSLAAAKK